MKKVVVVGGGFAGSEAARHLEGEFDVTLIDTKEYFEFTPGILRTVVEPMHIRKIQVLHTHYLKKARFILGGVSEVAKKYVVVNKEKVNYDYLVVASGSNYEAPFKESNIIVATRADKLRECYEDVKRSKRITIVGGGLVGVELAGEILWKYGGEKEVTIIQAGMKLIERNSVKAIDYATKWLTKRGARIVYGQRMTQKKGEMCVTDAGECFKTDMVFLCTGIRPNYGFMKKNFKDAIDERGFLRVNDNLQLLGENRIFAIGDVSNKKEEKTAQSAEKQAAVVVENIRKLEDKEELVKYVPKKRPMVISLGKNAAIYDDGKMVFCGWIISRLKRIVEWKEMRKKRR